MIELQNRHTDLGTDALASVWPSWFRHGCAGFRMWDGRYDGGLGMRALVSG